MTSGDGQKTIDPQVRDLDLLRGLFDSRLMTLTHAAALYFDGRREAAKKRVQKLKAAGLVGEKSRKAYEPSILYLTRDGFMLLQERGLLEGLPATTWPSLEKRLQVSELTLRHELEVMDVRAAVCSAIEKRSPLSIAEFSTWPILFQFAASPDGRSDMLVKPDGFIRIHEREEQSVFEHTFFLEVDRSTETLDTLGRRALCYLNYYQRGGVAERFGRPRSEYKDFPFRVLMVFKTAERRNNITERLLTQNPPILSQVWLSTLKEVLADPLGPVWIRPVDYRDALGTTPYTAAQRGGSFYRRNVHRETMVDDSVSKHMLVNPLPFDSPQDRVETKAP